MAIEIYDGSNWNEITNPEIWNGSIWQEIEKGEIWNGSVWQTFYERFVLIPQNTAVSNVSSTVSHLTQASLTFKFQHPGEPDRNTPVRIEYRLKNSSGTVIQTGEQTFASGPINENVTFPNLSFSSSHTFEARAIYTSFNETTAYSAVGNTTSTLTYSLTTSPASSVNEGSTMTATFTTNDTSSRTYYWRINHSGNVGGFTASAADFSLPRDASFSASSNNNGVFTISPIADSTTEGAETFGLEVAVDTSFFGQVANVTRTINDTSQTPTYSLSTSPASSVNEGSSMTATFVTSDPTPRVYYWQIEHITTSFSDFSVPRFGEFSASSGNNATFTVNAIADSLTEGAETFRLVVAIDNAFFGVVASVTRTINDTSLDPVPTFSLAPSTTSFVRGGGMTISVLTTNVQNGTLLYWRRINGTSVDSDFLSGNFEGAVNIQNNSATIAINTAFLNVSPGLFNQTDSTTATALAYRTRVTTAEGYRGNATFTVRLFTNSNFTNQVATTFDITILPETYNVSVSFVNELNQAVSSTYFIPSSGFTSGEINTEPPILTTGLPQRLKITTTATVRYINRANQPSFSTSVTRSTLREVTDLSVATSIQFGTFIISMTARGGAVLGNVGQGGTTPCIITFQLQRRINNVFQNQGDLLSSTAINDGTALRSVGTSTATAGTYRFIATATYPNHGSGKTLTPVASSNFTLVF